ncbi:MAG: histone deacetylase, partial [Actinomycetota bacterium]|nr:histone deacetylase [Actinomycetota bacterium]
GNGTASILRGDPHVFTFSIHGAKNYPFHKEESDLDIPLVDGTDDAAFLAALSGALDRVLELAAWDLAIFLAGADPFEGDKLGRLSVTKEGLARRDQMVLEACRERGIPIAVTMAGGYAKDVEDTVDIHFQTVQRAANMRELEISAAGGRQP